MKRHEGFTLIELMITVAVIAIIAAIAYPAYTDQIVKTRRGDAKAALSATVQALERCYTRYAAYNNANCQTATDLGAGIDSENGHYQLTATVLTANTYTLQAAPQGPQASKDTKCANFTLAQTGARTNSGSSSNADAECWGQ
ncbi:MAG: type IV pilin protein [Planctomycetota bacterium]